MTFEELVSGCKGLPPVVQEALHNAYRIGFAAGQEARKVQDAEIARDHSETGESGCSTAYDIAEAILLTPVEDAA